MALRSRNKINSSFSMSSMTDVVFLLLIFFMVTSTLVAPNAIKLLLPQSNNQTRATPITTVSIKDTGGEYLYYVGTADARSTVPFSQIEGRLRTMLKDEEEPTVSLHADKTVPIEEVVKIMNIAKNNEYKLILATRPLD
ncbi:MAG: biopolymer transporter ExbD [Bacteroidota bacterium]|nr:biopolymer transporter ExbD [Bacteroidota bacterium]